MKHLFKSLAIVGVLMLATACKDSTSPISTSPKLGNMSIGEMRIISLPIDEDNGLTVPQDMQNAEYLVIVSSIGPESGSPDWFDVSGNWSPSSAPVAEQVLSSNPSALGMPFSIEQQRFQAAFEGRMRAYARKHLQMPSADAFSPRFARSARAMNIPSNTAVGAQVNIQVSPFGCGLSSSVSTTGTVRHISQYAVIVVDNDAASGAYAFTPAELQKIGMAFDQIIYPTDVKYFGSPTDIDNNSRVVLYYTPQVNALTDDPSTGHVAGFFFPGDLVPANQGCPASNEGEIFYLKSPAPGASVFSKADVLRSTQGTIAHEFQHMINTGTRFYKTRTGIQESAWLDEALAHLAEDLVGRVMIGKSDLAMVSFQDLYEIDNDDAVNFFYQNLARTKLYLADMANASPIAHDDDISESLESRGAAWAFLRYLADWHSNNSPARLTRRLVESRDTGVVNVQGAAGVSLDLMLSRFLSTLYTDGLGIPGLAKQFNYRSYEFRAAVTATAVQNLMSGTYGISPYPLGNGSTQTFRNLYRGSGAYFILNQETSGQRLVTITGPAEYGRVIVLRLK